MMEHAWKIVIGGAGGVGKTTFIHYYVNNEFIPDTKMTIGVQFHVKKTTVDGNDVRLILWDLGGQERFRCMLPTYIKGAIGGLVLFDMSRYNSLVATDTWLELFKNASPGMPIILVGTKMDACPEDEIPSIVEAASRKASEREYAGQAFTSSASGYNVEETMNFLIRMLIDSFLHS